MNKTLIVITGPTGVGKTAAAIQLAQQLHCDIINADSRQIYRGIPICTAAPTPEELAAVRHHFVAFKDLEESYSAAQFETDVLTLLPTLWQWRMPSLRHGCAVTPPSGREARFRPPPRGGCHEVTGGVGVRCCNRRFPRSCRFGCGAPSVFCARGVCVRAML